MQEVLAPTKGPVSGIVSTKGTILHPGLVCCLAPLIQIVDMWNLGMLTREEYKEFGAPLQKYLDPWFVIGCFGEDQEECPTDLPEAFVEEEGEPDQVPNPGNDFKEHQWFVLVRRLRNFIRRRSRESEVTVLC